MKIVLALIIFTGIYISGNSEELTPAKTKTILVRVDPIAPYPMLLTEDNLHGTDYELEVDVYEPMTVMAILDAISKEYNKRSPKVRMSGIIVPSDDRLAAERHTYNSKGKKSTFKILHELGMLFTNNTPKDYRLIYDPIHRLVGMEFRCIHSPKNWDKRYYRKLPPHEYLPADFNYDSWE